jgi:homoserine dehydrogenase
VDNERNAMSETGQQGLHRPQLPLPLVSEHPVRIGILGNGNIGAALVDLIETQAATIETRTGVPLEIAAVAVKALDELRSTHLPAEIVTTDAAAIAADPDIDIVVELIGGVEPARTFILTALGAGKPVVTANKALVAVAGPELFDAADAAHVDFLFEAAVGGGIPIIRPLRESLAGDRLTRVLGIVNGTTNFILTRMAEVGSDFADAQTEAQQLGFAEADPTADVAGHDAAAKAAILATIAFGTSVVAGEVHTEGITAITATDIEFARRLGYVIKLLAIVEQVATDDGRDQVAARVHPAMVPDDHPLAAVRDSFNAVFVQGEAVDDLMFYGRGAGGGPTATAVLGDVVDAALNLRRGSHASIGSLTRADIRPMDELRSAYYLNLEVADRPGVLRKVAEVLEAHDVSVHSMEQVDLDDTARLIFITHTAREADVQETLVDLGALDVVVGIGSLIRVVERG